MSNNDSNLCSVHWQPTTTNDNDQWWRLTTTNRGKQQPMTINIHHWRWWPTAADNGQWWPAYNIVYVIGHQLTTINENLSLMGHQGSTSINNEWLNQHHQSRPTFTNNDHRLLTSIVDNWPGIQCQLLSSEISHSWFVPSTVVQLQR